MRLYFRKENFIGADYVNPEDCPIARCVLEHGFPLYAVGSQTVEFKVGHSFYEIPINPIQKDAVYDCIYYGGDMPEYIDLDIPTEVEAVRIRQTHQIVN